MTQRKYFIQQSVLVLIATFLWIMILCVHSVRAFPDADPNQADKQPYRTETFKVEAPAELSVETSGGYIEVTGNDESDEVKVDVYVKRNGTYLTSADTKLEKYELTVSQSGQKITARAKQKSSWSSNNISIAFEVQVPRKTSNTLSTSGGHIEVSGVEGNQDIQTSGGHLTLTDMKGTIDARTSGGHISLEKLSGTIKARTSGGHVNVEYLSGQSDIRTSGGHINLDKIAGTLEARTSGGNINAEVNEVGDHLTLKTSGGNINVSVPGGVGLALSLEGSMVKTDLENFDGSAEPNDIQGTIHGGGPKLTAKTSGGMVKVSFK